MKALVSGQAGLAVVLGDAPEFRPVGAEPYPVNDEAIFRALEGFSDIQEVVVPDNDVRKLDSIASEAWAKDRTIYQLYMLFDMDSTNQKLENSIADKLRSIVSEHRATGAIREWLSGVNLGPKHIKRAKNLAAKYPALESVITLLYPEIAVRETPIGSLKHETRGIKEYKSRVFRDPSAKIKRNYQHLDERPDTPEEREALRIAMSIIHQARSTLPSAQDIRPNLKFKKLHLYGNNYSRTRLRLIHKITFRVNQALQKERFRTVRPYTAREIASVLKRRPLLNGGAEARAPVVKRYMQQR